MRSTVWTLGLCVGFLIGYIAAPDMTKSDVGWIVVNRTERYCAVIRPPCRADMHDGRLTILHGVTPFCSIDGRKLLVRAIPYDPTVLHGLRIKEDECLEMTCR